MTNGQIQQLQDLSKCHMNYFDRIWVKALLTMSQWDDMQGLTKTEKRWLRGWTHKYRNQIKVIKKNAH